MKKIIILGLATLMSFSSLANNQELKGQMDVFKVTVNEAKEETIVAALDAQNGDLLEYKITYTNTTDKTFTDISIIGKIPNTTTFIKDSGKSFNVVNNTPTTSSNAPVYSIDNGATWSEAPTKKVVEGGKIVEKLANISDYTMIKWNVPSFNPKSEKVFKYRVLVNSIK